MHLVFLQKQIINQVKHSNTYYIIGVRMQVPIKKSRVHIWYELMFKAVSRSNKIQSRDQVISSPEVLSSRVTSTFRFLKVLDIPSWKYCTKLSYLCVSQLAQPSVTAALCSFWIFIARQVLFG